MTSTVPLRVVSVGILENERGQYLLCRMPPDRGVFPGQWGLPGGGIEPGETACEALQREIREELGLEISNARPFFFADGVYPKTFPGGQQREFYMIFLLFACRVEEGEVRRNAEFDAHVWVDPADVSAYDLNRATRHTFSCLNLIPG